MGKKSKQFCFTQPWLRECVCDPQPASGVEEERNQLLNLGKNPTFPERKRSSGCQLHSTLSLQMFVEMEVVSSVLRNCVIDEISQNQGWAGIFLQLVLELD